jgi:hypothetical protein
MGGRRGAPSRRSPSGARDAHSLFREYPLALHLQFASPRNKESACMRDWFPELGPSETDINQMDRSDRRSGAHTMADSKN